MQGCGRHTPGKVISKDAQSQAWQHEHECGPTLTRLARHRRQAIRTFFGAGDPGRSMSRGLILEICEMMCAKAR